VINWFRGPPCDSTALRASTNRAGRTRKAKLLRLMDSLLLLQSLGFLSPSANGFPGPQHGTAKMFRDRSEISVIECHNRSGVTIAGRFQNHLIIRIR
jgi:hypothetical protein